MSKPIFSLEEIAEAFKYIQDDKLSTDAKAMLTMDIGYEKAEKEIIKLLEKQKKIFSSPQYSTTGGYAEQFALNQAIALIKGEN